MTFDEWLEWWGDDLDKRGRHRDSLVMARHGDKGPYALGNIKKITARANLDEADKSYLSAMMVGIHARRKAAGIKLHLEVRGDGHPKSKPVITPAGRFGSASLAADHYGITRAGACWRVKNGVWQWA